MSEAVFTLPYFGPISFYKTLVNYSQILLESKDNYQKQTYRNRQYIYGANGKLMLNIPVKRSHNKQRLTYKECQIENDFDWQSLHFKSLETAYRTSPYFEFYEADIEPLFKMKYNSLYDYNLACFNTVNELLDIDINFDFSKTYQKDYQYKTDHRHLIDAKNNSSNQNKSYHQVFEEKHGFINDLSILDLLFNLGPESMNYLKSKD